MGSSGDAKGESKKTVPTVFRPPATIDEQLEYFTDARRKEAMPRELELTDPHTSRDDNEADS